MGVVWLVAFSAGLFQLQQHQQGSIARALEHANQHPNKHISHSLPTPCSVLCLMHTCRVV